MLRSCLILAIVGLLIACGSSGKASDGEVSSGGDFRQVPNRELLSAIAGNDVLRAAQAAVDSGHPWRSTLQVTPLLSNANQRTPAALLVAARSAAGWGGWSQVDRLLAQQTWLDAQFGGEGRELLARSALERGADTAALTQSAAAVRGATEADARAVRNVLLARSLERNNHFDSAAAMYTRAAEQIGPVRDWLRLRAAGSFSDSSRRAKAYAGVTSDVAKTRIAWTDAQARERFGDAAGAAARYAELGAVVPALRLRLSVAPDPASRSALKGELLKVIRERAGTSDARTAVDVLDKSFPTLAPADELLVARSAATTGPWSRASTAFGRATAASVPLTPADRLAYAQSLARAGRTRDALAQFALVPPPLAAQAAYQQARVLLTSGTNDATRAALRDVVTRHPTDTDAASGALFLLADLATDARNDAEARSLFEQIYRTYPASSRAGPARFNAAVITLAAGDARTAALKFDSLVALMPRAEDALAARFWSGRSWAAAGNDAQAKTRWREVVAQQPASYYGFASAKRLGERPFTPPSGSDEVPRIAAVDNGIARAELLEALGMDTEARFEYDALDDAAFDSNDRAIATAHAFVTHGQASRAIRIAQKLADGGQRDPRVYRLLFPVVDRDELTRAARARRLEPALVAGIIRQESSFNPRAISVANARGLMQLLPNVGAEVSRALSFPVWDQALLFDPDANLQLGTAHLASYVAQYGALPRVLAAYNAGGSRVSRWSAKAGMNDPELFVERIPFVETRDYVRIVQRNAEIYRWILDTGAGRPVPGAR